MGLPASEPAAGDLPCAPTPQSLWAPWRGEYFKLPRPLPDFLQEAGEAVDDATHLVLERAKTGFLMMNRYPYAAGHLMAVPYRKVGEWGELSEEEVLDLWRLSALGQQLLRIVVKAQGFNIGLNLGVCAGAGVADHLHLHLVPRWEGDSNFMPVIAGMRVQSDALESLHQRLVAAKGACGCR